MPGEVVRIDYYQGDVPRFIKGTLLEETDEFVKIQLQNYVTTIYKKYIIKLEKSRWG